MHIDQNRYIVLLNKNLREIYNYRYELMRQPKIKVEEHQMFTFTLKSLK